MRWLFFSAPFWTAEVSGSSIVVLGNLQACGRTRMAISLLVAPAVQGRWPSPSQSSLTSGWEAAGCRERAGGFGQEVAPGCLEGWRVGALASVLKLDDLLLYLPPYLNA